jgi:acyl-CoA thioester hydrolase
MPEVLRLRVQYADTDAMGVAWHGSYLRWFERARTEMMRAAGLPYTALLERGLNLPAVEALVRYRKPARFDDELIVRAAASRPGAVRLRIDYRVERDGTLIAEGHTEHAFTDNDGRVRRPPRDVQEVLTRFAAAHGD